MESGIPYFPAFIPAICNLYVEVRTSPEQPATEALAELVAVIRQVVEEDGEFGCETEVYCSNVPGMATSLDSPIVEALLRAREYVLGNKQQSYPPIVAVASSDANFFRQRGIPVATCGPGGDIGAPGGINMWAEGGNYQSIEGLLNASKIYVATILDLQGV